MRQCWEHTLDERWPCLPLSDCHAQRAKAELPDAEWPACIVLLAKLPSSFVQESKLAAQSCGAHAVAALDSSNTYARTKSMKASLAGMPDIKALLAFLPTFVNYMVALLQMAFCLTESEVSILNRGVDRLRNSLKDEPPASARALAEALEAAFLAMHEKAALYAGKREDRADRELNRRTLLQQRPPFVPAGQLPRAPYPSRGHAPAGPPPLRGAPVCYTWDGNFCARERQSGSCRFKDAHRPGLCTLGMPGNGGRSAPPPAR